MSPTITALIVTYEHARYIEEAVVSALSQTRPPDEILVVDDGSCDGTVELIRRFPTVRILELPHRGIEGLSATYDAGLDAARGELVALLEGDDRWPPTKLELQLHDFRDDRVVLSHGLYSVIGARGAPLHKGVSPHMRIPPGMYDARPFVLRGSYIMAVTSVIRREALRRIGGFRQIPGTPHWDYPTFLALSDQGPFAFCPVVTGEWRRHGASVVVRLAGIDVTGAAQQLDLALGARARMGDKGLPTPREIRRSWADAHAIMVWQSSRMLLRRGLFAQARSLVVSAMGSSASLHLRARLLIALVASLIRVDLEWIARVMRGKSTFSEMD